MANLLPEEYRISVKREYCSRRLATGLVLFAVLLATAAVLLVPAYIVSSKRHATAEQELMFLRQGIGMEETEDPAQMIAEANAKLSLLADKNDRGMQVHRIFALIITHKNSNIAITDLSYDAAKGADGVRVSINGTARDRAALSAFARELENEPRFANIDLPISNFVKETDIDFSLTLTATDNEHGEN